MLKKKLILLLIIWLTGCAGFGTKPDQIKVNISDIQMLESTLMEQRFLVKLRIMNRSKQPLMVDGMSFDLELNRKEFASGVSNEIINIQPLSEGVVAVRVTSTIFGIIRQLSSLQQLESKPFEYELSGHIYTSGSMFGVPFKETGEIDLKIPAKAGVGQKAL